MRAVRGQPGLAAGWLRFALILYAGALQLCAPAQTPGEELRTAASVRRLTVEEAQQHRPVRLRGVVTFFNEGFFSHFIQDETAGIYLNTSTNLPPLVQGQWVEVEGVTGAGEFAPVVIPTRVSVLGQAPLPAAQAVSIDGLTGGQKDSQFVEVRGIVRSVQFQAASQLYLIEIATGGSRLSVYTRQVPVARPEEMLDSTIRARGVCSTKFNRRRQLFAVRVMVPRVEDLVVEALKAEDPFAAPARPIDSLLQFSPKETYNHRIKVGGAVIYFEAGKLLFLQEADQGIAVQTLGREPLALGDRVEALGFVGQGDYTPSLQDAIYRRVSAGQPLRPMGVGPDEVLQGNHDCQLIRVEARLLERAVHGTERYLVLQENGFIFDAYLSQAEAGRDDFAGLRNGSRVSVTGVCRIEPGEWQAGAEWRAKSFRVQLRSIADVLLLQSPSWWTLSRVLWIAAGVGVMALLTFGWVVVLRGRVEERGRELEVQIRERQRAERDRAIEQERTRVAQDLHDELGATLTEVSLLGSLARTPGLATADREGYLDKLTLASRVMVTNLDEIVWAVNPKYDFVASLASYYSLFAQRFLNLAGIACRLQVAETFPGTPLESRLRHGMFLAFKEALNNAVRHSNSSEISVDMQVIENQLKIAVTDNGRGFVLADCRPGSTGLTSMEERMTKLGGRCEIRSEPGKGTTVEFWLPLGGPAL